MASSVWASSPFSLTPFLSRLKISGPPSAMRRARRAAYFSSFRMARRSSGLAFSNMAAMLSLSAPQPSIARSMRVPSETLPVLSSSWAWARSFPESSPLSTSARSLPYFCL